MVFLYCNLDGSFLSDRGLIYIKTLTKLKILNIDRLKLSRPVVIKLMINLNHLRVFRNPEYTVINNFLDEKLKEQKKQVSKLWFKMVADWE